MVTPIVRMDILFNKAFSLIAAADNVGDREG
jgi:hypothetical protein